MKKLFISFAALAALVGCSEVTEQGVNIDNKQSIALSASIAVEDTRVTVEGEKFTDVKWEQGDAIKLESAAGVDAVLNATAAGDTDIRFEGEGALMSDVDTYYAVYPVTDIVDGTVAFDYAVQSGDDVAVLVAKSESESMGELQMSFKPVNALLHVAVSGAESLAKAELSAFDGSAIASTFSYNFSTDETSMGGDVDALVVENPAADGFFFRLPASLDMSNGYIVTLTDGAGNVCSKAYNGKVFERGTTTRVAIEWSLPTVTLATPMTSYSYYAAGDSATANNCANNVIYFNGASTFDNVQKAMVVEAGYVVDGQTYAATLDVANKSFSIGNITVSSWGSKSVEAYIKTKDGRTIKSAAQTVHITGLPYHADWRSSNYSDWKLVKISYSSNRLQVSNDALGCIISPEFKVPYGSIRLNSAIAASTSATSWGGYTSSYAYVGTRSSSAKESGAVASVAQHTGAPHQPNTPLQQHNGVLELTSSNPCVVMTAKDFAMFCDTNVYQAKITYAQ